MLNKWINEWIYLQYSLHGCWANCKILQSVYAVPTIAKKEGCRRGRWSMTGRQLAAWFFVWGGLQAEFPPALFGLITCRIRSLPFQTSARSLSSSPPEGCQLSHLCQMSWQSCTWNTGLTTFKGFFSSPLFTEENIHMYFVKDYAGFLLLLFCPYSCAGDKLPRGRYFLRLLIRASLCYSSVILYLGDVKYWSPFNFPCLSTLLLKHQTLLLSSSVTLLCWKPEDWWSHLSWYV